MKNNDSILIVEDESIIAEELKRIVMKLGYTVTAVVHRYEDAVESLRSNTPSLVLLDIGLDYSDKDGIELAEHINEKYKIPFIYITANADSLTVNRAKVSKPHSYILKPFNEETIYANLEVALYDKRQLKMVIIKQGTKKIELDPSKILYVKADNIYIEIYLVNNKKYVIRSFLKKFHKEELPHNFFVQVHRSYLINRNFIQSYTNDYVMVGEEKIPVGSSYRAVFSNL